MGTAAVTGEDSADAVTSGSYQRWGREAGIQCGNLPHTLHSLPPPASPDQGPRGRREPRVLFSPFGLSPSCWLGQVGGVLPGHGLVGTR